MVELKHDRYKDRYIMVGIYEYTIENNIRVFFFSIIYVKSDCLILCIIINY